MRSEAAAIDLDQGAVRPCTAAQAHSAQATSPPLQLPLQAPVPAPLRQGRNRDLTLRSSRGATALRRDALTVIMRPAAQHRSARLSSNVRSRKHPRAMRGVAERLFVHSVRCPRLAPQGFDQEACPVSQLLAVLLHSFGNTERTWSSAKTGT